MLNTPFDTPAGKEIPCILAIINKPSLLMVILTLQTINSGYL